MATPHPYNGFSLVDLLMDYIHLDGDIREWMRGAFLVIFCVCSLPAGTRVEEYLEKSVFCQVKYVCACMRVCIHVCTCVCETVKDQAEWQACAQQPESTAM